MDHQVAIQLIGEVLLSNHDNKENKHQDGH